MAGEVWLPALILQSTITVTARNKVFGCGRYEFLWQHPDHVGTMTRPAPSLAMAVTELMDIRKANATISN